MRGCSRLQEGLVDYCIPDIQQSTVLVYLWLHNFLFFSFIFWYQAILCSPLPIYFLPSLVSVSVSCCLSLSRAFSWDSLYRHKDWPSKNWCIIPYFTVCHSHKQKQSTYISVCQKNRMDGLTEITTSLLSSLPLRPLSLKTGGGGSVSHSQTERKKNINTHTQRGG